MSLTMSSASTRPQNVSAYRLLCNNCHESATRNPRPRRIERQSTSICPSSNSTSRSATQTQLEVALNRLDDSDDEGRLVDDTEDSDLNLSRSQNTSSFKYIQMQNRDWNQQLYVNICRRMDMTQSQKFLNSLVKDTVDLRGLYLGSSGAFACSASLANNAFLRTLHLESNRLECGGAEQIAKVISDNPFLTNLALVNNGIGEHGLKSLVDALVDNTSITHLNLSGNRFEEKCGELIRYLLDENKTISNLSLNNNNFREKGSVAIAYGIAHNTTVRELDLSWNHVRMKGSICLCDCLKVNKGLQHINYGWNGFFIEGCRALAKSLALNTTLISLDFSCNRIDQKCLEFLLKGLKKNSTLKSLKISQNPLTAEMIREFLGKIEDSSVHIEQLDLTGLTIDPSGIEIANRIAETRKFEIIYGVLLKQETKESEDEGFLNDDPMMVMMEFMKLKNMRLVDLFMSLDADGSKSLSHKEFREGLMTVGVPMSQECISRLIRVLDRDGDGEIDYSELIAGQKEHRRRLMRIQVQERNVPYDETELGMINLKLRKLLAARERAKKANAQEKASVIPSSPTPVALNRSDSTASSTGSQKKVKLPKISLFDIAMKSQEIKEAISKEDEQNENLLKQP